MDYASIVSNSIGHKLSNGSINDFYSCCRMNFAGDVVQTSTPQFMDMGFSNINTLDEISGLSTSSTIIRRPMDGPHWSVLVHVSGEATVEGMIEARSYHDYNYKT